MPAGLLARSSAALLGSVGWILILGCPTPGESTPASSIEVTPVAVELPVGQHAQLAAAALGDKGQVLSRQFTWRSSSEDVATVSSTGLVQAKAVGAALISAETDGISSAATVTVIQPVLQEATIPFTLPVTAVRDPQSLLSQDFGEVNDASVDYHTGIDVRATLGTPVIASAPGWVAVIQEVPVTPACGGTYCDHQFGNTVILGHLISGSGEVVYTQYSHLSVIAPALRALFDAVPAGCLPEVAHQRLTCTHAAVIVTDRQPLGQVGQSTSALDGVDVHLHFEIKRVGSLGTLGNDAGEFGYAPLADLNNYYLDPVTFLHWVDASVPLGQVRVSAQAGSVELLMGPGGSRGGVARYRAITSSAPGDQFVAIAFVASTGSDAISTACPLGWYQVRRPQAAELFHDDRETEPGRKGAGDLIDAWMCRGSTATPDIERLFTFSASLASSSSGPSDLYQVGLAANGSDQWIGRIRTAAGYQPTITDLALGPKDTLWAVSFDHLYRVDPRTAVATDRGVLGILGMNALAENTDGQLYGASLSGGFYRISAETGSAEPRGSFGGALVSSGDLAFIGGQLYASVRMTTGDDALARVDLSSGAAGLLPGSPTFGRMSVFGLTATGTEMYGLTFGPSPSPGQLILLDPVSGSWVRVRDLGFGAGGASLRH